MAALEKLIAGNWKMNMLTSDGVRLARDIAAKAQGVSCDLLVCPPATILNPVAEALSGSEIAVGGQDCHEAESGAFTGDVSAAMVGDAGASHVILGHSERRHGLGESDAHVRAKTQAAHAAGLVAIVCIGETEAERDAGQTLEVLSTQLAGSLPDAGVSGENTVIAYEPVWAIGTGRTPTLGEVEAAHGHIRSTLETALGTEAGAVRLLYGGSMKPENAQSLLAVANVDGGLIGGASLDAESFLAIAAAGAS
ncbi:MAG: triose-phosphate isomerase [Alphaproteobacteria bacterium]